MKKAPAKMKKKSMAKMAKKSPVKKPLVGKQNRLPKELRDKILAFSDLKSNPIFIYLLVNISIYV